MQERAPPCLNISNTNLTSTKPLAKEIHKSNITGVGSQGKMLTGHDETGVEGSGEEVKSREGNAEGRSPGEAREEEMGLGGEEEEEEEDDDDDARENNALKKRISSHPLYNKLVEIHLNCLKVSGVVNLDTTFQITQKQHQSEPDQTYTDHFSDLDQFMEAYCLVLSQLREAMEEPQQETVAFIDNMHSQLQEIITTHPEEPPQASPSLLTGEASF